MRMPVQMPRPVVGTIPDPHGIVADDDGLSVYEISARLFSQENASVSLRVSLSWLPGRAKIFLHRI